MAEGHTIGKDGTVWTIRLRESLRFHDNTPVLARDVVASIRRFAARDAFGRSLMMVTDELIAVDDRTVRFRLTKPFPHLLAALAGSSTTMPCIMRPVQRDACDKLGNSGRRKIWTGGLAK